MFSSTGANFWQQYSATWTMAATPYGPYGMGVTDLGNTNSAGASARHTHTVNAHGHTIPALRVLAANASSAHNVVQPSYACRWITRAV